MGSISCGGVANPAIAIAGFWGRLVFLAELCASGGRSGGYGIMARMAAVGDGCGCAGAVLRVLGGGVFVAAYDDCAVGRPVRCGGCAVSEVYLPGCF